MTQRRSQSRRLLPLAYGIVPTLVVAFVLPSALRPPPDTATSGSAYSPDAPPNKNAQTIIKSQQQAGSQTAGQPGAIKPVGPSPTPTPSSTPPSNLASRAGCFPGNPPRQIESVYSVVCQPVFTGNNGGATGQGVTATDIRLAVLWKEDSPNTGEINDQNSQAQSSAVVRTLNDLRKYFNQHYEFYGRHLRFFGYHQQASENEAQMRADADDAVAQFHPLADWNNSLAPLTDEFAKHGVLSFDSTGMNTPFRKQENPYSFTLAVPDDLSEPVAESLCKQFKGYPAASGTYGAGKTRTFGMISVDDPSLSNRPSQLKALQSCGLQLKVDDVEPLNSPDGMTSAVRDMFTNGVSTIIFNSDLLDIDYAMTAADSLQYRPEWFSTGWGVNTTPLITRAYPTDQAQHLMGINMGDITRDHRLGECFRAVRSVDAGFDADETTCNLWWQPYVEMANAIQMAGPDLNARTLAAGFRKIPYLQPDPKNWWHSSGGYISRHPWSYLDSADLWWWNATLTDPDGNPGTYVYSSCGHRYTPGGWPGRPAQMFTMSHAATGLTFANCRE